MNWKQRAVFLALAVGLGWLSYESSRIADHGWATACGVAAGVFFTVAIAGVAKHEPTEDVGDE